MTRIIPDYPKTWQYCLARLFYVLRGVRGEEARRLRYWTHCASRHNRIKVKIGRGIELVLDTQDVLSRLIFVNNFEVAEREFITSFLQPGDVFFDIGANIGLFSILAAHTVAPTGRVYAFEPISTTYQRLVNNAHLNDAAKIIVTNQLALADQVQTAEIWSCYDGYSAWSSLGKPTVDAHVEMRRETVACTTLDRYVEANGISRVDLVKIDVEGWEEYVLRGASNLLMYHNLVLLIEFTDANAVNAGTSTKAVRRILENAGYNLYRYNPTQKELVPEPDHREYPYVNLIACRQPSQIEARLRRMDGQY